ncbi:NUDIX hydrolase [Sporosarcina beigongshangi]|uniref:NUDIX hydrolase n=1 Tax=Sporosarcina beigongshangi TaxID=2782538 RepID=UPI001939DF0F|nr:NUDIX domain-containing protein [Sporosarcina beigongshangi]
MERLKVFDESYTYVKEADRDEVHRQGLWHETFHCWLVDDEFVYIQKRSAVKKDFPGLFDITAAGHILATETVMDGIREVEEELGLAVDMKRIDAKGIIRDVIELPGFIDREFANVFLYHSTYQPSEFLLQQEEVASVHAVKRQELRNLFLIETEVVVCTNIFDGTVLEIGLVDFVPHERTYFEQVARLLK